MPTLLVATVGGHLPRLVDIATRLPDDENNNQRVWVTHNHDELTVDDLRLAAGHRVERAPDPPKFELAA
jgi:hypothetical protein